ncbi:MAG: aconitase/3-isopropylmalate dehydratase large subunit family protein [Candidatus Thermoplasmatota archaeon]|nr:aconitase/3-isopropylmalate dehydratase large subunit family protein [Candidatus Thermoplasmatota archaeon]
MNGDVLGSLALSILSDHMIEGDLVPGDYGVFFPDHIMGHDVTTPPAMRMLDSKGVPYLRAAKKIYLYLDHFTPPKDLESAESCRAMTEFSSRHGIANLIGWGEGICHVHLFEGDRVKKGDLVIGADSHITTGGALGAFCTAIGSTDLAVAMASGEFWLQVPKPLGIYFEGTPDVWCEGKDLALMMIKHLGPGGANGRTLEMKGDILNWIGNDSRMTLTNMASEIDCISALTNESDDEGPGSKDWDWETEHIDVTDRGPQISLPGSPDRVDDVYNHTGKRIDQVFIGSCTNGRMDDLRVLADILKGKKIHPEVKMLVVPGSRSVYTRAARAGYVKTIMDAGGIISMPTCGPCAGGFLGVLPAGEVAISTTNRNFKGRMGDPTSKIYLSGVAVAAASALKGVIAHPSEVVP